MVLASWKHRWREPSSRRNPVWKQRETTENLSLSFSTSHFLQHHPFSLGTLTLHHLTSWWIRSLGTPVGFLPSVDQETLTWGMSGSEAQAITNVLQFSEVQSMFWQRSFLTVFSVWALSLRAVAGNLAEICVVAFTMSILVNFPIPLQRQITKMKVMQESRCPQIALKF